MANQQADSLLIGLVNKLSSGAYQDVYNGLDINWDDPRSIQSAAKQFTIITKGNNNFKRTKNIYENRKCCK